MDYPNKRRLKIMARSSVIEIDEDDELSALLTDADYKAKIERFTVFDIEAFDWNCPQHITQRFTFSEIESLTTE
jgi:predicted pyridoxine 5'-phosphate oxidase superfamily flavin-nucleotide-binding protein